MKCVERWKRSFTVRMKHVDDHGMNEDSNKSQTVYVHLTRKTVNRQRHELTTKKKRYYENEGSSMHDASCIGINYAHAHRFPISTNCGLPAFRVSFPLRQCSTLTGVDRSWLKQLFVAHTNQHCWCRCRSPVSKPDSLNVVQRSSANGMGQVMVMGAT